MQIFPAIDLLDGKAVRLAQGRRESAKIYSDAPWELAAEFAAAGAPRLHVVDLDAALSGGAAATTTKPSRRSWPRQGPWKWKWAAACAGSRTARVCSSLGARYAVHGNRGHQDSQVVVKEACADATPADRGGGGRARRHGRGRGVEGRHDRDALEMGRRWPGRAPPPCCTPTSGATACARGPISRQPRGWRLGSRRVRSSRQEGWRSLRTSSEWQDRRHGRVPIIGKAIYERAFTIEEAIGDAFPGAFKRQAQRRMLAPNGSFLAWTWTRAREKGRALPGAARRGRSGRRWRRNTTGRAPTKSVSSTSRPRPRARATMSTWCEGHRRAGVLAADRGRGRSQRGRRACKLLLAGADKVGINTAAVSDPDLVRRAADAFGSQAIVVAVDARPA